MTSDVGTWQELFPSLARSQDAALLRLMESARSVTLGPGAIAFHAGAPCQAYLLVLSGRVRVAFVTEAGREVALYHVGPGESCILTTSCILGSVPYPADGITESAVTALVIDAHEFELALNASPDFRNFRVSERRKAFRQGDWPDDGRRVRINRPQTRPRTAGGIGPLAAHATDAPDARH